jgi:hypothetical protein
VASPSKARYAVSAGDARERGEATSASAFACAASERAEEHEREPEERVGHAEGDDRSPAVVVEQGRQQAADADRDGERRESRAPPRQQRAFLARYVRRGVADLGSSGASCARDPGR